MNFLRSLWFQQHTSWGLLLRAGDWAGDFPLLLWEWTSLNMHWKKESGTNKLQAVVQFFTLTNCIYLLTWTSRVLSILSDLTGQAIPVAMKISLLMKTIQAGLSNPTKYLRRRSWLFIKNSWKKAFHCIMAGPAIIRPDSSNFWKAPLV